MSINSVSHIPIKDCRTTPKYWDCNCDKHYMQHAFVETCPVCGAIKDEQPDSMIVEVQKAGLEP